MITIRDTVLLIVAAVFAGSALAQFDPTPETPLYEVDEGETIQVPLNRGDSNLSKPLDVALSINKDRVVVPEMLTFPAGESTIFIPVSAPNDAEPDGPWLIRVVITPPSGLWVAMDVHVTEDDTDTAATLSFGPSL